MIRFAVGWWRAMGIWGWPNLLLVGVAFWLAIEYQAVAAGWTSHGARAIDDVRVSLATRGKIESSGRFEVMLEASGSGSMRLTIGADTNAQSHTIDLSPNESLVLTVTAPEQFGAPLIIQLTDRGRGSAAWNLGRLYDPPG